MRRLSSWLLLIVFTGCDAGEPVDPCAGQIEALAATLTRAADGADPLDAPARVPLPEVPRGAAPGGLPLLVVGASEVSLDGRGVGGLDQVERTAETLRGDLASRAALLEGPLEIGLWADPAIELVALTRLLQHAPPEVRFALLARGPAIDPPAAPAWVREELERPEPPDDREGVDPGVRVVPPAERRRRRAAAAWPRATESCPAARAAFPFTLERTAPPSPRSARRLVEALGRCGCEGRTADAIAALAFEALRSEAGPLVRVGPPLRFGPATGDGAEVTLPPDADVAALAAREGLGAELTWIRVD